MLNVDEIKNFIDMDAVSDQKRFARVGVRYYEADHDIKNYRLFYVDADGKVQEEKTKSNIKISHPYFTELVDQCTQYSLPDEGGFVKSDDPKLQEELDRYFGEDFIAEMYDTLTGSQVKGFDYMYAYKGEDGRTRFEWADGMGVVEVRARDTDDGCDYVIYSYVDRIGKDNKQIKRIQVWDDSQTYFYCQVDGGDIELDADAPFNPRPHTLYSKGKKTYFDGFGLIPFFCLPNNRKKTSDLKPIKPMIDDYDLMNCGLSNNIQDTNEALYVIKGFEGDNLDELIQNIKTKKHIGVGEGGDVEIKTIDIPVEARKAKLEIDERNIYKFGFGLNTADLKDSNATVSVAIKSMYSLLELKAKKKRINIKQFMRKLIALALDEINALNGTDYQQKDVYFDLEPELPTNEQEHAQIELSEAQKRQTEINTLLSLAVNLGNDLMMELICEQLDISYEDIKDRLPEPEADPYAMEEEPTFEEGGVIG